MSDVLFNLTVKFDDNTTKEVFFKDLGEAEAFKEKIENNKHTDTFVTFKTQSGVDFINPKRAREIVIVEVDNTTAE